MGNGGGEGRRGNGRFLKKAPQKLFWEKIFWLGASGFKKKSGVPSWVSKICRRVKVTFILDVLSFGTRGAKERTKENADAPAGARVRYFLKKVAQKLLSTVLCEHGALPYAEKRRCLADVFRSAIKYVRTIINS